MWATVDNLSWAITSCPSLSLPSHQYYRQALRLVSDIESRVSHGKEGGRTEEEEEERGVSEDTLPGLVQSSLDTVCEPKSPSNVSPPRPASTGPALYSQMGGLVLWLFLLQVCRGFYLLAREAHLWRMACRK